MRENIVSIYFSWKIAVGSNGISQSCQSYRGAWHQIPARTNRPPIDRFPLLQSCRLLSNVCVNPWRYLTPSVGASIQLCWFLLKISNNLPSCRFYEQKDIFMTWINQKQRISTLAVTFHLRYEWNIFTSQSSSPPHCGLTNKLVNPFNYPSDFNLSKST